MYFEQGDRKLIYELNKSTIKKSINTDCKSTKSSVEKNAITFQFLKHFSGKKRPAELK